MEELLQKKTNRSIMSALFFFSLALCSAVLNSNSFSPKIHMTRSNVSELLNLVQQYIIFCTAFLDIKHFQIDIDMFTLYSFPNPSEQYDPILYFSLFVIA